MEIFCCPCLFSEEYLLAVGGFPPKSFWKNMSSVKLDPGYPRNSQGLVRQDTSTHPPSSINILRSILQPVQGLVSIVKIWSSKNPSPIDVDNLSLDSFWYGHPIKWMSPGWISAINTYSIFLVPMGGGTKDLEGIGKKSCVFEGYWNWALYSGWVASRFDMNICYLRIVISVLTIEAMLQPLTLGEIELYIEVKHDMQT